MACDRLWYIVMGQEATDPSEGAVNILNLKYRAEMIYYHNPWNKTFSRGESLGSQ